MSREDQINHYQYGPRNVTLLNGSPKNTVRNNPVIISVYCTMNKFESILSLSFSPPTMDKNQNRKQN